MGTQAAAETIISAGIKTALDAAAAETNPANKNAALQALADGYASATMDGVVAYLTGRGVNPGTFADAEARPIVGSGVVDVT